MIKRGKVLRDKNSGPGLLIMEGQQYRFSFDYVWKSEAPPKPGLVVDVELDASGKVHGITVVPDSQLAKEQAEAAVALARPRGRDRDSLGARVGTPSLAAAGILAAAWVFLTAASIQVPFPGRLEFTFWQILGFLNAGNVPELLDRSTGASAGFYGLAAVVALAGPFIHHFWKDKYALLGGLLPLVFMVVVGIAIRSSLQGALGSGNEGSYVGVGKQAHLDAAKVISLGLGAYFSILVSLYIAFTSAKSFLAAKALEGEELNAPQRKAA
jgi:hypothetical protein